MSLKSALTNSKGQIFYGMHFYPGLAQYDNADGSFRVFVNEDTIRKMSPSFAGRPVFVEHVEEVEQDVNELRNEADGWVIESFYNAADGKTWAKFIIVSDRGFKAIANGFRLSNAYIPELSNKPATWNGMAYQKVVTGGEYEHLAIVQNPRYEESVIMTPDEFKAYNENLNADLKRIANSTELKGDRTMKLNIFKRQKIENSIDLEGMVVELPKSKKEILLTDVIAKYDVIMNMNGYANGDHMVKVGEKDEMSVNDLVKKHMDMCNEMDEMKKNAAGEDGGEPGRGEGADDEMENADDGEEKVDVDGDGARDENDDESIDSEYEKADKKISKDAARKSLSNAKAKALALKNAHTARSSMEYARVDLAEDQIARGKARYGSK